MNASSKYGEKGKKSGLKYRGLNSTKEMAMVKEEKALRLKGVKDEWRRLRASPNQGGKKKRACQKG